MSVVKIKGDGWLADVLVSDEPAAEYVHLQAWVSGDALASAKAGAQWVMDYFGKGRTCFVRSEPEAASETDFDTKEQLYRGYVRFSWENASHP